MRHHFALMTCIDWYRVATLVTDHRKNVKCEIDNQHHCGSVLSVAYLKTATAIVINYLPLCFTLSTLLPCSKTHQSSKLPVICRYDWPPFKGINATRRMSIFKQTLLRCYWKFVSINSSA